MRNPKPKLWILFLVWVFVFPSLEAFSAASVPQFKNAVVPIYLENQAKPVASVRVERVYQHFQKRWHFRIGVLPLIVCENVTVEFHDLKQAETALAACWEKLAKKTGAPVELRKVRLRFSGNDSFVEAKSLAKGGGPDFILQNAKIISPNKTASFRRVTLDFHGGSIRFASSDAPTPVLIFSPSK